MSNLLQCMDSSFSMKDQTQTYLTSIIIFFNGPRRSHYCLLYWASASLWLWPLLTKWPSNFEGEMREIQKQMRVSMRNSWNAGVSRKMWVTWQVWACAKAVCCIRVIPCEINTKKWHPSQNSSKLGTYIAWVELTNHSKFQLYLLYGFVVIRGQSCGFLSIFSLPPVTKLLISLDGFNFM